MNWSKTVGTFHFVDIGTDKAGPDKIQIPSNIREAVMSLSMSNSTWVSESNLSDPCVQSPPFSHSAAETGQSLL